jgi:capsular polysaccharide biosynthesis protein
MSKEDSVDLIKTSSSETSNSNQSEANCSVEELKSLKCASSCKRVPGDSSVTLSAGNSSLHLSNIDTVSWDRDMYIYGIAVKDLGKDAADYLAKQFGWQVNSTGEERP